MRRSLLFLWCLSFVAQADEPFGSTLASYYGSKKNYQVVKAEVMVWWGTTTNGCVAFASTVLRELGVEVPLEGRINGERISLLTLPFSRYLQEALGWERISDASLLLPGDLVFTEAEEYPLHVFVFHSWKSKKKQLAYAIDNQKPFYVRALLGDPKKEITAFSYALRAP
jgi:hypothetical protein